MGCQVNNVMKKYCKESTSSPSKDIRKSLWCQTLSSCLFGKELKYDSCYKGTLLTLGVAETNRNINGFQEMKSIASQETLGVFRFFALTIRF